MLPNLICIVENYNCGSWVVVGVADIDDRLGLDCQTSFNGLGAKGVYREVLIINFTPINSLSLPPILWFILGWGRERLDEFWIDT